MHARQMHRSRVELRKMTAMVRRRGGPKPKQNLEEKMHQSKVRNSETREPDDRG